MKFSTGSSTMKQTVLVSPTQKNEAGAQSFPLRCGVTGFAGWSTGTFLIPVLSARTPFVLPAAALFRLLKKRLGSRVSGDTEQIDLRERGVAVFSSSADGFLPLLFLNRRRNSGGWAHLSFAGGRMLDVVLPQEKRCGYAGPASAGGSRQARNFFRVTAERRPHAHAPVFSEGAGKAGFSFWPASPTGRENGTEKTALCGLSSHPLSWLSVSRCSA